MPAPRGVVIRHVEATVAGRRLVLDVWTDRFRPVLIWAKAGGWHRWIYDTNADGYAHERAAENAA